jgi:hypothetical protein
MGMGVWVEKMWVGVSVYDYYWLAHTIGRVGWR